jgi:hypothetical protein
LVYEPAASHGSSAACPIGGVCAVPALPGAASKGAAGMVSASTAGFEVPSHAGKAMDDPER